MFSNKRNNFINLISIFTLLTSLSSCKKYDYYKYSKRWYCEELDFEFYNIVEENDWVGIFEKPLILNGKEYLFHIDFRSPKDSFWIVIVSKYGTPIFDYELYGSYYIDRKYTSMTCTVKTDTLFRKYEGQRLVFTSTDIDPSQTFDPAICSSINWCTEDKSICIESKHTRNLYGIKYRTQIYPFLFSGNNVTAYEKPNGEVIFSGTYTGNHRNWSIEIESKSGIFTSYDSNRIDLINMNTIETAVNVPLYEFSDDNYQEIIDEFESMYN